MNDLLSLSCLVNNNENSDNNDVQIQAILYCYGVGCRILLSIKRDCASFMLCQENHKK
jgi:hypothetical protein